MTNIYSSNIQQLKAYFYSNLYITKENVDSFDILSSDNIKTVCIDCDSKGETCKLMSGFSHTSDFNNLLNKQKKENPSIETPNIENGNDIPIMFLLENPGTNWWGDDNTFMGKTISYNSLNYWFSKYSDFENKDFSKFSLSKHDAYAFNFTHLMYKYKLTNVLITNSVKCKPENKDRLSESFNLDCMTKFLLKEIEIFKPKIIITFGRYSLNNLNLLKTKNLTYFDNIKIFNVFHPSARKSRVEIMNNWYNVFDSI